MKSKRKRTFFLAGTALIFSLIFSSCLEKGDIEIQQGAAAFQRKEFEKAISLFQMGLSVECSLPPESVYLGMIYRIKQDDETAEKMYRKALDVDPDNAAAYGSLGALCLTHNRIDEAIYFLEEAETVNPRAGIVHADLAICYARKGDFEKAEEQLELAEDYKVDNLAAFKAEVADLQQR